MPFHNAPFRDVPCLASVDAELISVNANIVTADELKGLNLFLSPSNIIDGCFEELRSALVKHMHHRSTELPGSLLRRDKNGGVYKARRLKGNGLYSGPHKSWLHHVRNIKKDATGYVLGLQAQEEYEKSLSNSHLLREMGIETEIPEGAFLLKQIIYKTRDGACRIFIDEAFDRARLPVAYKHIPFVIRVDALGSNHRLKDYIFADELLAGTDDSQHVREAMLQEAYDFVRDEFTITQRELPPAIDEGIVPFVRFVIARIMRNVALMHKHGGIHGQLTSQNLTLDGKFIDYDTLKWEPKGGKFDEGRIADLEKIRSSLTEFVTTIFNSRDEQSRLLDESRQVYDSIYQ